MARIKKMAMGGKTSLGMKSVKDGYDKNPGITRADTIIAAKQNAAKSTKAKKGMKVQKAQKGKTLPSDYGPGPGQDTRARERQRIKELTEKGPMYDTLKKKPATPPPTKKPAPRMKKGGVVKKKAMGGMTMMKKGGKMKKCKSGC